MRIFVGEYMVGGGLADQPIDSIPASLRREGKAMLRALVADLAEFADVVVLTDSRMVEDPASCFGAGPIEQRDFDADQSIWPQWIAAATGCDAALIIAPESNGVLAQGVAMLRAAGIDVVAGSGDFLRTASDKLLTARSLSVAGVSHPAYLAIADVRKRKSVGEPRTFRGQTTRRMRHARKSETFDCLDDARNSLEENDLLQAWMPGRAASISMIASATHQVFLPAVSQHLEEHTCVYSGGQGPTG